MYALHYFKQNKVKNPMAVTVGKPDHTARLYSNHTFWIACCISAKPTNGMRAACILANNSNTTKRKEPAMTESKIVAFFKCLQDAFLAPTCCDEFSCNQGRDCPVRTGEYKPKEAIHQIQEADK